MDPEDIGCAAVAIVLVIIVVLGALIFAAGQVVR